MPEISTTGYENCIRNDFPELSRSQAKRLAKKVAWRVENMTRFVGATQDDMYETALRILGIHADPTARDAVRNIEAVAA